MTIDTLLDRAREEFEEHGLVPIDTLAQLDEAGFDLNEIDDYLTTPIH